jgi:uncharacterized membrane protein YphA (DoxX/SURF4 family)
MGLGQKLSVNIAPLLLRTALAATFIWIGTPMLRTMELTPEQTAQLANAEIRSPTPASTTSPDPDPSESPDPDETNGVTTPPPLTGVSLTGRPNPAQPATDPDDLPNITPAYTPEQFSGTTQQSRRWVLVSLAALDAAQPVDDGDDTTENRSVLPDSFGNGGLWVKVGSIAFALIVAIGGYAVILGFFTRVWAFLLAVCTGLSMWVLEIGPTWAARDGILGFIPDPQLLDPDAALVVWMRLILHLVVLMTALALLLLGPGKLSLDALMFRGSSRHRSGSFDGDGGLDE